MSKMSGPLLDRIDIHIEVAAVPFKELSAGPRGTDTAAMRQQVAAGRARAGGVGPARQVCQLDDPSRDMLEAGVNELGLSARAHDKILRVARTIADLDDSNE